MYADDDYGDNDLTPYLLQNHFVRLNFYQELR